MRLLPRLAITAFLILAQVSAGRAASIVTEWLDEAVPAANESAWEPTIGARFLAIFYTALYDAWAAYDPVAVGYACGTALKGQGGISNEANKREAISHAAYTVLRTLVPHRQRAVAERMQALGYAPNAQTAPARVGRAAAAGVLALRAQDGANAAENFTDTTGYAPQRPGTPAAWRPIDYFGRAQLPITPHWGRVVPFALTRADEFRPPSPPAPGSPQWTRQIQDLIDASRDLTDAQKAAAEYWAPWGSSPAPHLLELTRFYSNSNDLRLDDDAKLFFVVANAVLDASIATWEGKYVYDYLRPVTAIQALGDARITAWHSRSLPTAFAYSAPLTQGSDTSGTPAGVGAMRAAEWMPYLPTPPFPAYVSGHSAFTAAWAQAMELASGGAELNLRASVRRLFVEQRQLEKPVSLFYPTFASAADASGMSRIWGGIHWPADNEQGQILGRKVGKTAWQRAQQFFLGTASPASAALATLGPPFWFAENIGADPRSQPAAVKPDLAMNLPPARAGAWRSIVLDPLPAGAYDLALTVKTADGGPVRFAIAIEMPEASDKLLGSASAMLAPMSTTTVRVPWTSEGVEAFRIVIKAEAGEAAGHLLVSTVTTTRMWPQTAGARRFYETSSAGLPGP